MVECMLLPLCRCVMPNDHLAASTFEDLFCATIWQQLFYRRQQHGYRNVCDRCTTQQIGSQNIWYPLPETNIQPQKCRGWKIDFLLRWPVFRGYVSFRECIRRIFSRISECFSTRNLENWACWEDFAMMCQYMYWVVQLLSITQSIITLFSRWSRSLQLQNTGKGDNPMIPILKPTTSEHPTSLIFDQWQSTAASFWI